MDEKVWDKIDFIDQGVTIITSEDEESTEEGTSAEDSEDTSDSGSSEDEASSGEEAADEGTEE